VIVPDGKNIRSTNNGDAESALGVSTCRYRKFGTISPAEEQDISQKAHDGGSIVNLHIPRSN
jgi:hypothetical protein